MNCEFQYTFTTFLDRTHKSHKTRLFTSLNAMEFKLRIGTQPLCRHSPTPARALHQNPTRSNRLARKNCRLRTPKRTAHHPTQPAQRSDAERLMKME